MSIPEWLVRYTHRVHLTRAGIERMMVLARDLRVSEDQVIDAAMRTVSEQQIQEVVARDVEDTRQWRARK